MNKLLITHVLAVVLGIALTAVAIRFAVTTAPNPEFHEHADIAVFINGQRLNLAQARFMSEKPCGLTEENKGAALELTDKVHLHDMNGNVIHTHYPGVTYQEFFKSIAMEFRDGYLKDADGAVYENGDAGLLRYFLNGKEVPDIALHQIHDLDRVLISYGRKISDLTAINAELAAVSDEACIASGKCTSRGVAPVEACGAEQKEPWILKFIGIGVK